MIVFRDRSYCFPKTCVGKCGRQFTVDDHLAAVRWWGGEDYPLSLSDYCKEYRE